MPIASRKAPILLNLADVQVREIEWLWWPYLPYAACSMIFGPGGQGKSTITIDFASRVSRGMAFPGQERVSLPEKVLLLSAEDEADAVLVPRLIASGANMANIFAVAEPFTLDLAGRKALEKLIREVGARFVIIDPILAYMGGKMDMNKANEVREMMGALHRLAISLKVCILIVHHARKGRDGMDFERAMGSVDFNNAVRSVLYTDRDDDNAQILRHVKHNYSPEGDAWFYKLQDNGVLWETTTEAAALTVRRGTSRSAKLFEAQEFLLHFLQSGRATANETMKIAEQEGITKATLQRARKGIVNAVAKRVEDRLVWYWELLPDAQRAIDRRQSAPQVGPAEIPRTKEPPKDERPDLPSVDVSEPASDETGAGNPDREPDAGTPLDPVDAVPHLDPRGRGARQAPPAPEPPLDLIAIVRAHRQKKAQINV